MYDLHMMRSYLMWLMSHVAGGYYDFSRRVVMYSSIAFMRELMMSLASAVKGRVTF